LGSLLLAALTALAPAATPWTATLTQQALTSGYNSSIPPHVAQVLGLSPQGTAVETRQLVSRAEQTVRTFNVSVTEPHRVVLFVVDERAHKTVVYLVSGAGKLRKGVSYEPGGEPHDLPDAQARSGLAREVRFWSEHATATTPAAPPGAPPAANTPH
ncbi:MAG TPA: hypothetical protein VEY89_10455, partial [Candidatus Dormibacteraeota bacterium]|nr:hypothetical protein [Candidatus Dormibacteraeota bacterium]